MANKNENTIEIYKANIKSDKQQKANLQEELKLLEEDLKNINNALKGNNESMDEIKELQKYLRSAANNMTDAVTDLDGYFQGNLANEIADEYGKTGNEIIELYNSLISQYGNVDAEVEELKAKKKIVEEKIEDIKRKIATLDNSITTNNEALGKLQKTQ